MILPKPLSHSINLAPLPLVQQVTRLVFNQALRQHPNLFDRLGSPASKSFRFTPRSVIRRGAHPAHHHRVAQGAHDAG
jgi:predicted lipid carrier protein YhbT